MSVRVVNRVISFGDSLSDRGKMYKRLLFGIIPLAKLSGLEGKSPFGRFTNQYTWLDHWTAVLSESNYIKGLEARGYSPEAIMQLLLTNEEAKNDFHNSFHLDNDAHVRYYGQEAYSTYCEGGATAADWSGTFTWNIARNATRKLVTTLEKERTLFLAEEEAKCVSQDEKDATLITVFIGANDLITVNDPSALSQAEQDEIIEKAVKAQMEHIQALIDAGYTNFSLTNLPDLGLTPRFQQNNWAAIGTALTDNYNKKLKDAYTNLQEKNKVIKKLQCNFYDIHAMFNEVYQNPEKYGFDRAKLTLYFKDSEEFIKSGMKHAGGYLFWDEVHPTAKMHKILEEMIAQKVASKKLYDYSFVVDDQGVPSAQLTFEVKNARDEELEQIINDVDRHQNKVIFVKNNDRWSCYRYDAGKIENHYVAKEHWQTLENNLKRNQFSPSEQYALMKLANRQHWGRGVYLYKNRSGNDVAKVIHKAYIPCDIYLGERKLTDNSYSLYFNQETNKWLLEFYPSDIKGKGREIDLEKIKQLADFLKGKTKIGSEDRTKVKEMINEFHMQSSFEYVNLSQLLQENPNPEITQDLMRLTSGKQDGPVIPCDETIKLILSHCQGPHDNDNHYIIEPEVPGYHLQYRDKAPSPDDKKMVQARRGTTILVYFTNEHLTIGFCGKHGFREQMLDKFEHLELINAIDPQNFNPPQTHCILERTANLNKYIIKDSDSPADTPFAILDSMIKSKGGYGFDEASLMFDFAKAYKERWTEERFSAFFGSFFMKTRIDPSDASLERILRHALKNGGERTRGVLVDLGWIDSKNNLRAPFDKADALVNAYNIVKPETSAEALVTYAQFRR